MSFSLRRRHSTYMARAHHHRGTRSSDEAGAVVAAARTGDESAFGALLERYRRELQLHCYRMLGSFEDSEDLVQETLLRAWRKRKSFEGRSSFRVWLYGIATNACLDALRRNPRRARPPGADPTAAGSPAVEIPWLQPYPDRLLEGIAADDDEPDAAVVAKETLELAYLVAIQLLPPRQRAALILRDVLGWSAKDTAALLETSVPSANSALQRARAKLRQHLPPRRLEWTASSEPSEEELAVLQRYMDAHARDDVAAVAALLREDARFSMPPQPERRVGREAIISFWVAGGFGSSSFGNIRCLPTRANMQPAAANYLRRPGDSEYRAMALDVLRIEDGAVAEVTTFAPELFPAFGLPQTL
jgi:RNA polymerase sigma-70 factor (ECF subfamily)